MGRGTLVLIAGVLLLGCRTTGSTEKAPRDFALEIEGNEHLTDAGIENALEFELAEITRSGLTPPLADDAAYQVRQHYSRRGFPFAVVEFRIEGGEARKRLVLSITEGERVTIDEDIAINGVSELQPEEVRSFFEGPRTGSFGTGPLLYMPERVAGVSVELRKEYIARGYLDARIDPVDVRFSEDRTRAHLTLEVEEGQQYRVLRAELPGREELDPNLVSACEKVFGEYGLGRPIPYHPRFPWELRGALRELLLARGHPDAAVDVDTRLDTDAATVLLVVTLDPGPRARVGQVTIVGRERTRPSFVESRILLEPGDMWTVQAERESFLRLYESGLFRRVSVSLAAAEAESGDEDVVVRDLVVEVQELPAREYWVEPGYGSYEGLRLRSGVREKSLFGTGRQLALEGTVASKALRGRIGLLDPWFFRTSLVGDASLTFEERENPSFTQREKGIGTFVTKNWTRRYATTFGYQFRRSEISDFEEITGEVTEALENVDLSSLRLSHRYDTRRPVFLPADGNYFEGALEWGAEELGSEIDFLRTTISGSTYFPLREGTVLATSLRLGVIEPRGDDDTIPVQERFFSGGENSVRSFKQDELGPKDADGDPVGGEAFKTWSIELRQRLGSSGFEIAAFYDIGDVQSEASDWGELGDLESGLGLGLRYLLPVGPLRLDAGWNPNASGDEDDYVIHFALGIAF